MRYRTPYPASRNGFTLIEILLSTAIMVAIFAVGAAMDNNFYRRANLSSERDSVVALLARARSEAVNNVDQSQHGLYVASSSYVIFEGGTFASRNTAMDETFPIGNGITASGTKEFAFKALEGSAVATGTLTLIGSDTSFSIRVNQEGMIDW